MELRQGDQVLEAEVVVDASVVVKWFPVDEDSEKSLKLSDDYVSHKK